MKQNGFFVQCLVYMFKLLFFVKGRLIVDNPIRQVIAYAYLRSKGVECDYGKIILQGFPIIHKTAGSRIILRGQVHLISKAEYNVAGINHRAIIATTSKGAKIVIDGPFGASGCSIVASNSITIKRNVSLGVNTKIYDNDFHPVCYIKRINQKDGANVKNGPITIEENVWVGSNSTILKNVIIGKNSVIGANSLVLKSVPPDSLAGNPYSRFIRTI